MIARIFGLGIDFAAAWLTLPTVEDVRWKLGPAPAARAAREMGHGRRRRDQSERIWLRRIIRVVDRLDARGPNCYRRALLEMALDGGAAMEPLMLGFRASGGRGSGHAWLQGQSADGNYDAVVSV